MRHIFKIQSLILTLKIKEKNQCYKIQLKIRWHLNISNVCVGHKKGSDEVFGYKRKNSDVQSSLEVLATDPAGRAAGDL